MIDHPNWRPLRIFVPHPSGVLTDHLPNGDGLTAYAFLQRLAARGHEVFVVAQRVDLHKPLPANIHIVSSGEHQDSWSTRLGHMMYVRRLYTKLSLRHRFDIIHQMNPVFAGISLALWNSKVPVVLGTYVARWPDTAPPHTGGISASIHHAIVRLQQSLADRLLLTTPAALNRIPGYRSEAWRSEHIRWLSHGVDADVFSPSLREQVVPQSILFLANVETRKGITQLLQAFAKALHVVPQATLTVAGDGSARPDAEDLARQLEISHAIKFIGSTPHKEVAAIMQRHSCYCLPSLGEPYASSLLEAMSCGLPCIITNAGGLPHMLPQQGGICIPPGDAPALAEALHKMLLNPVQANAMGAANRACILRDFTWTEVIAQLEAVYFELLDSRATRR